MTGTRVGSSTRTFLTVLAALTVLSATACMQGPPPGTGGTTTTTVPGGDPGHTDQITVGDWTAIVEVDEALGLVVDVTGADGSELPPAPDDAEFPMGPLAITVDNATAGAVIKVTVTIDKPANVVYKLLDGQWGRFRWNGTTGAKLTPIKDSEGNATGTIIELYLQDGGRGDNDGVADGHIADPVGPAKATELTVTTHDLPRITEGQAFDIPLETAGAQGPVTWTQTGGFQGQYQLKTPDGRIHGLQLEVTPDGHLKGLAPLGGTDGFPGLYQNYGPLPVRVEATDGVTTVSKLLVVGFESSDPPVDLPTSTAGSLPDGESIRFWTNSPVDRSDCEPGHYCGMYWFAPDLRYRTLGADGQWRPEEESLSTTTLGSVPEFHWITMSPNGSAALITHNNCTEVDNQEVCAPRRVELVDSETGSPLANGTPLADQLTAASQVSMATHMVGFNPVTAGFSPDSEYVYTRNFSSGIPPAEPEVIRVFDTASGSLVRAIQPVFRHATTGASLTLPVSWSPDGKELISRFEVTGSSFPPPRGEPAEPLSTTIGIAVIDDPTQDRSITLDYLCRNISGWSTTGRLLLGCAPPNAAFSQPVTVSTTDENDVHDLSMVEQVGEPVPDAPSSIASNFTDPGFSGLDSRFSPSGSHIVAPRMRQDSTPAIDEFGDATLQTVISVQWVVLDDSTNPTMTPLTEYAVVPKDENGAVKFVPWPVIVRDWN